MSTDKIAKLFKDARLKKGFTQAETAKLADMNVNSIAKIERGERQPNALSIKKLSKALGLDASKALSYLD